MKMPSERHIIRQVEWRNALQKYGGSVRLEHPIYIRGAKVVVDVYAESEGKAFLIEIGNIDDRKKALMQYYAEANPNISFIHEPYDSTSLIPHVLESLETYRKSPEYKRLKEVQRRQQELILKKKLKENKELFVFLTLLHLLFSLLLMSLNGVWAGLGIFWLIFGFIVIPIWYDSRRNRIKLNHMEKMRKLRR